MDEKREGVDHFVGSDNVFADLGIDNPEEALLKAQLAYNISTIIEHRQLSYRQTADLLGIEQAEVAALVRGYLTEFSVDRLMRFLTALDRDVQIVIRPKPATRERGLVSVVEQ